MYNVGTSFLEGMQVIETGTVVAAVFAVTRAIRASPLQAMFFFIASSFFTMTDLCSRNIVQFCVCWLMQDLRSVSSLCSGLWLCGAAFLSLRLIKGVCHKAVGFSNMVVPE